MVRSGGEAKWKLILVLILFAGTTEKSVNFLGTAHFEAQPSKPKTFFLFLFLHCDYGCAHFIFQFSPPKNSYSSFLWSLIFYICFCLEFGVKIFLIQHAVVRSQTQYFVVENMCLDQLSYTQITDILICKV